MHRAVPLRPLVFFLVGAALWLPSASSYASCDLSRAGVVLVSPGSWSPELIEDLCQGLAAVPIDVIPGGALELELHPEPSPLGMGDGAKHREWSSGLRRFHLYAYADPDGPVINTRLDKLTPDQVRHLWRRRAIVHAVIRRLDRAHGWSDRPEWRRIAGWIPIPIWGDIATLDAPWGYTRQRGGASAALDLATFAEDLLVPPEAVGTGPPRDDSVRCQEFLRSRFLLARLDDLVPGTSAHRPRGACPAFDGWYDPATLDHVELLFAEPTARHPESAFGHLILRLVRSGNHRDSLLEAGAAVTPTDSMPIYIYRGLTGGYPAIFTAAELEGVLREDNQQDQRTLRRFRLHLRAGEQTRLLERMWELERRAYTPYRFLDRNCASLMVFTLAAALDEDHQPWLVPEPYVMPQEVLDALAQVEVDGGGSLMTLEPGAFQSTLGVALDAERDRTEAVTQLIGLLPGQAEAWRAWLRGAEARDHAEAELGPRVEASLAATTPAQTQDVVPLLRRVVRDSLAIERYAADRALIDTRAVDTKSIIHDVREQTVAQLIAERRTEYRSERADVRMQDDMEKFIQRAQDIVRMPRRPLTPKEQQRVDQDMAERSSFVKLAGQTGEVLDKLDLAAPSSGGGDDTLETTVTAPDGSATKHLGSGRQRWALGAAMANDGAVGLWSRGAFFDERVGEQRDHGGGPWYELTLLNSELATTVRDQALVVDRFDLVPVRMRSLLTEPAPLLQTFLSGFGRGFGAEVLYDAGQLVKWTGDAHFELYQVLDASPNADRILALGFGPEVEGRWRSVGGPLAVGPRFELIGRLPLFDGISGLRLEGQAFPAWAPWSPQAAEIDLRGSIGAELGIGPDRAGFFMIPKVQLDRAWVADREGTMIRGILEIEPR